MFILTNNRVKDAVAGKDQHFLKISEGPFSHDAGHLYLANVAKMGPSAFLNELKFLISNRVRDVVV